MATLSLKARWHVRTPEWSGNREADAPFKLKVRRLTVAEFDSFKATVNELGGQPTAADLAAAFAGIVEGPVSELVIDGEAVADVLGLMRCAVLDGLWAEDGLFLELFRTVLQVNTVAPEQSGN